jgi:hypothetical protein
MSEESDLSSTVKYENLSEAEPSTITIDFVVLPDKRPAGQITLSLPVRGCVVLEKILEHAENTEQ